MPRPVPLRGVIEGFYGTPWSHDARLEVVDFIGARGMNAYVYAPKSDPKHRDRWREPYDRGDLDELAQVATRCTDVGARFGFAIAPGLDIDYADERDRHALLTKLGAMLDVGIDWFVLALDDIPNRPGLATEHARLTAWMTEQLENRRSGLRCSLVPTEYVGTRPSPYLTALATELPPEVDLFWTGPTVCSPTISADAARSWRHALGGRPLLLWDNYPVNDTIMERELHLGPYRGREPGLSDVVDGILCNPMLQPRASLVALSTAAEYCRDPSGYDEAAAWDRALADVGGEHAAELRALARACCDGPLATPDELPAAALVRAVETASDGPGWTEAVAALREELDALRQAGHTWRDDPLATELAPWLDQATRESDAALAALHLIQTTHSIARTGGGDAPVVVPDPEDSMIHAFALLFAWSAARDARPNVVLGPRFAMHPAVVQGADGTPVLDVALALREDCSLVDRIARYALARYARSTGDAPSAVVHDAGAVDADRLPFREGRL